MNEELARHMLESIEDHSGKSEALAIELQHMLPTHPPPVDPVPPDPHPPDPPIDPPDPPVDPPIGGDTLAQDGISWHLDREAPAVRSASGEWLVPVGTQVVGVSPGWYREGERHRNGSMLNPQVRLEHGYDSTMYAQYGAEHFKPDFNVDPAFTGKPVVLANHGDALVSTISIVNSGQRPQIDRAACLMAVNTLPDPGWDVLRPGLSGEGPLVFTSTFDLSRLANVELLPGAPDVDEITRRMSRLWLDHSVDWLGRYTHPAYSMPDYGREIVELLGWATTLANCDIGATKKLALVAAICQRGLDYAEWANSSKRTGNNLKWMPAAGGHCSGRKWLVLFTGIMLNDQELITLGADQPKSGIHWHEDGQTFLIDQLRVAQGYTGPMLGKAEWAENHRDLPQYDVATWKSEEPWPPAAADGSRRAAQMQQNVKYRRAATAHTWWGQATACVLMNAKGLWDHAAFFDYMERYDQIEPAGTWKYWGNRWSWDMWNKNARGQ